MSGTTVLGEWVSTIADVLGVPDPIDHSSSKGSSSSSDGKSSSDSKGGWLADHNFDD